LAVGLADCNNQLPVKLAEAISADLPTETPNGDIKTCPCLSIVAVPFHPINVPVIGFGIEIEIFKV